MAQDSYLSGPARLGLDAAGVVSASILFEVSESRGRREPITLGGFARHFLEPPLRAVVETLRDGSMLGRVSVHFWMLGIGGLLRIEDEAGIVAPTVPVPFETEITLPSVEGEASAVAAEASRALAREGGREAFE